MMTDFMLLGACVYANSRHVMDTITSEAVRIAYANNCQAIEGVSPVSIHS